MTPQPSRSLPVGPLLGWLCLVVLWLTWTPTATEFGPLSFSPLGIYSPSSLIGNLALFAPIAAILATLWAREHSARRVVLRGALVAAVLSGLVELVQFRVPGRTPLPWDLLLNTLGGAMAAWATLMLIQVGLSREWIRHLAAGGVWIGVLVFLSATGFAGPAQMGLEGWNADHEVLTGDEWGGGRTYLGEVTNGLVCAGMVEEEVCATPGAAPSQRDRIERHAVRSQRVRVSASVLSEGPQPTLARIVTFSRGAWDRNVTLAQEERDLVFRIRTPATGPNGSEVPIRMRDAVPDGVPLVATGSYAPGQIVLEVSSGGEVLHRGTFAWGFFSGWWFVKGPMVEPRSIPRAALVAAAGFSLPLGLAVSLLGALSLWARIGLGALAAPALVTVVGLPLGIPLVPIELGMAAVFGGLGGMLGRGGPDG